MLYRRVSDKLTAWGWPDRAPRRLSINDQSMLADDGTRIAYRVEGSGPALVLTNGLTTTTTFWKYVRPEWLDKYTVVTWDLPGHGNSGPAQSPLSADVYGQPRLIASVMREVGIERAVQIGWSTGAQVALEMVRQFPQHCEGVAMVLGGAGHVLGHTRWPVPGPALDRIARMLPPLAFSVSTRAMLQLGRTPPALSFARKSGLIGPRVSDADAREIPEHLASMDERTLQALLVSAQKHTAHAVLAGLTLPLLIVAGDQDPFAPTEQVGLKIAALAPHAELLRLTNGTHTALLEEPELIGRRIQQFIEACYQG